MIYVYCRAVLAAFAMFAFSAPVQSGLLIVGTLCYCLGGLLCLWGAWRHRRVASEAKQMEAKQMEAHTEVHPLSRRR